MDQVPARPGIAGPYRKVLGLLERYLPIGGIDPAWYQVTGVGLSFAFLYPIDVGWKVGLLAVILNIGLAGRSRGKADGIGGK